MDYWIKKILIFLFFNNVCTQQFFNTMPPPVNTNFTCRGRDTGFYADAETNCRVYHMCDENGNKFTYYCPAETAFRQEALVCDHAHLVDCANGRRITRLEETGENGGHNGKQNGRQSSSFSGMISPLREEERNDESLQSGSSNSAYTRSFRITQEPKIRFSTPVKNAEEKPTFVLSSSVFLRDRTNPKRNPFPVTRNNRVVKTDDFKNSNFTRESGNRFSGEKNNRREEQPRIFSSISTTTTTMKPFESDFQIEQLFRNPMIFRPSNFDKEEITIASGKFLPTTTVRPSVAPSDNYRGFIDGARNPGKFKNNYENSGDSRNFGNRMERINEKSIPAKMSSEFDFEEKRTRDKKIDTRNNEKEFGYENTEKNGDRTKEFFDGFAKFDKSSKDSKVSVHERPPFFHDNINFPYSETLRSMQAMAEKSISDNQFATTAPSVPTTTAGTEFPVHPFPETFSLPGPNELDDDPYYPKLSTTTEIYYKLNKLNKEGRKASRFSTKRPWPGSLNFEIPEVLPDLNTLDDLVDRRKHFYIPRVKTT